MSTPTERNSEMQRSARSLCGSTEHQDVWRPSWERSPATLASEQAAVMRS